MSIFKENFFFYYDYINVKHKIPLNIKNKFVYIIFIYMQCMVYCSFTFYISKWVAIRQKRKVSYESPFFFHTFRQIYYHMDCEKTNLLKS